MDASADAPSTPPTGSSDAQSRGMAREDSSAESSARKPPAFPGPSKVGLSCHSSRLLSDLAHAYNYRCLLLPCILYVMNFAHLTAFYMHVLYSHAYHVQPQQPRHIALCLTPIAQCSLQSLPAHPLTSANACPVQASRFCHRLRQHEST